MSRQYWETALPPFHIADGAAGGTSAAIADISPTPNIVIPANMLEVGSRLMFEAYGRYTSAGTPGTVVLGAYLAGSAAAISSGQALAVTAATTLVASQTNRTWRFQATASVRAVGTSGSIIGVGQAWNLVASGDIMAPATAPAAVTYDTTVPLTVRLGVTPSVATQSWTVHLFTVELIN